jgi:DegV family protein with EDD domain
MSARVAVATDSSACLPVELAAAWGVFVIPLQVIIDDEARDEGEGIAPAAVVDALTGGKRVTTSQPRPEAIRRVIDQAADAGAESLVVVTLSAKMSGTAGAVEIAAAEAGITVSIVDSATVSLAHGLAALSAAAVARSGGSLAEVEAEARRASRASLCLFTVDTLEYLKRGGRVSPAVAAVGNALGVRPVLGVIHGAVEQVERVRSSAKARHAVLERIVARAPAQRHPVVGLMGVSGDDALLAESARQVGTRGDWPVVTAGLSAALAAHAGPGALAAVVVDCHPEVDEALRAR